MVIISGVPIFTMFTVDIILSDFSLPLTLTSMSVEINSEKKNRFFSYFYHRVITERSLYTFKVLRETPWPC